MELSLCPLRIAVAKLRVLDTWGGQVRAYLFQCHLLLVLRQLNTRSLQGRILSAIDHDMTRSASELMLTHTSTFHKKLRCSIARGLPDMQHYNGVCLMVQLQYCTRNWEISLAAIDPHRVFCRDLTALLEAKCCWMDAINSQTSRAHLCH